MNKLCKIFTVMMLIVSIICISVFVQAYTKDDVIDYLVGTHSFLDKRVRLRQDYKQKLLDYLNDSNVVISDNDANTIIAEFNEAKGILENNANKNGGNINLTGKESSRIIWLVSDAAEYAKLWVTFSNSNGERIEISKMNAAGDGPEGTPFITSTPKGLFELVNVVLSSIEIATVPDVLDYTEGETFDPTGVVIKANYDDNTSKAITNYTYTPNGPLTTADTKITFSYKEGNITKTITQAINVKAKADPNPGPDDPSSEIEKEIEKGANVPDIKIPTTNKELEDMCLTEAEKQQMQNGSTVKIVMSVEDADKTVSNTDKDAIKNLLDDWKVGQYLDIAMFKEIDNNRITITETDGKVTIVVNVPDSLRNTASGVTRNFAIVRVHNGQAEILNDLDNSANTITIETDRFSTYAIVYKDTVTGGNNNTGDNNNNDSMGSGDSTGSKDDTLSTDKGNSNVVGNGSQSSGATTGLSKSTTTTLRGADKLVYTGRDYSSMVKIIVAIVAIAITAIIVKKKYEK